MKTLNITPEWSGLMPAFFSILEHGRQESKDLAKLELMRLAKWADDTNAAARAAQAAEAAK